VPPLTGKSALVTGGAKRIGRAIALALAGAGADVTITWRGSGDDAVETVDAIEQLGRRGFALECNVRSEQSVRDALAATLAEHGRLDILVNNAAIFESAQLDQITLEQWDAIFETNTRGPFLVSREAVPYLRQTEGRIINMGSLGGLLPWATHGHYCSSKAALHMLTKCMAKAFGPQIAVNCVAPGWIDMDPEPTEETTRTIAKTPMRRAGDPQDIAEAVLFFATTTRFVTGQILAVDGGLSL
jgi:NAD(P)-dependent dehydrogenase (short-subunit alcohol dehydrogenase family)